MPENNTDTHDKHVVKPNANPTTEICLATLRHLGTLDQAQHSTTATWKEERKHINQYGADNTT